MNTNKTGCITSIIEKRRPLAAKIAVVEADLKSLDLALRHLEEHRNRLLVRVDDPNVSARLREIDLAPLRLSINTELKTLFKLKERFYRKRLNIGVVGRARQGKSRLLQSLTGLTAAEIPDDDRQDDTSVYSKIYPNDGQIAFVDMPGLGDTDVGDEQRLIKTLGQDVDAMLFVRMPKSSGDYWENVDMRLYDMVRAAQVDLPIDLWSFMIINRTESNSPFGDNLKNCQDIAADIASKNINVVECITANCANIQEANKVLDRVLNYLAAKITDLDYKYAFRCQQGLIILQNRINVELEKVSKALDQATHDAHGLTLFEIKFQNLWRDLTNGFDSLLYELRKKREKVDIDFKKQVEVALQACRSNTGIPSIEEIEQRNYIEKGYGIVYEKYLNEIRVHLSQHLLSLNYGLKRSLDKVKSQVAAVLIEKGLLGRLTEARSTEFIKAMTVQIPDELMPGIPSKLKYGFQILAEFELSYRGLIQHRIRQHLDELTPNESAMLKLSTSPSAQQVLINLKIAHAETVCKCENALKKLLCEPSQAAFAIVEEFIDCILRAKDVENEWRIFLQEVRSQVWQEFPLGDYTEVQRQWLNSVKQATAANQSELMQFLH